MDENIKLRIDRTMVPFVLLFKTIALMDDDFFDLALESLGKKIHPFSSSTEIKIMRECILKIKELRDILRLAEGREKLHEAGYREN